MLVRVCAWCGRLKVWRWHVPVRIDTSGGICTRCKDNMEKRWRQKLIEKKLFTGGAYVQDLSVTIAQSEQDSKADRGSAG